MNSLENQNMINDLHIENGSRTRPPEYPQYEEHKEQAEINSLNEWSAVKESGEPDARGAPGKKPAATKAATMAQRLKQLLTFVAFIAAAAIVVPDIVPIDLGAPRVHLSDSGSHPSESDKGIYPYTSEDSISLSGTIDATNGDKLTVIVENDFIKLKATLTLGEISVETTEDGILDYSEGPSCEVSGEGGTLSVQEWIGGSSGPNPSVRFIEANATGLKENMTYRVTVICGNSTLYSELLTTGLDNSKI